jgi:hypothetical protein
MAIGQSQVKRSPPLTQGAQVNFAIAMINNRLPLVFTETFITLTV